MGSLSKLSSCSSLIRSSLGRLRNPTNIVEQLRFGGDHPRVFRKRPGQLLVNRIKDVVHFYTIGACLLPFGIYLVINHIIFGPCELKDYPTEGPPPRYWQFERTVPQQLFAKYIGNSDLEFHEANLAKNVYDATLIRWRRLDRRVKHLQGERWDYKGFHYRPITTSWIEYGEVLRNRFTKQQEHYGIGTE